MSNPSRFKTYFIDVFNKLTIFFDFKYSCTFLIFLINNIQILLYFLIKLHSSSLILRSYSIFLIFNLKKLIFYIHMHHLKQICILSIVITHETVVNLFLHCPFLTMVWNWLCISHTKNFMQQYSDFVGF